MMSLASPYPMKREGTRLELSSPPMGSRRSELTLNTMAPEKLALVAAATFCSKLQPPYLKRREH